MSSQLGDLFSQPPSGRGPSFLGCWSTNVSGGRVAVLGVPKGPHAAAAQATSKQKVLQTLLSTPAPDLTHQCRERLCSNGLKRSPLPRDQQPALVVTLCCAHATANKGLLDKPGPHLARKAGEKPTPGTLSHSPRPLPPWAGLTHPSSLCSPLTTVLPNKTFPDNRNVLYLRCPKR